MNSETASRRPLIGLAGLASLCCVGTGTVAVAGGVAAGSAGGGIVQMVATVLAIVVAGAILRSRGGCSACRTE
ncbi:hypothetical protein [Natrononativus amylolyticus]|uniref:hypothetical protein n=1 Tax=Natrononativus amylolyticus TaxID=2963434 RepID=UPI0020CCEE4D|nr:hypothetical protein [Natrononativus amylolyticus]